MLKVRMTPNLLGFRIAGSYDDLDELYDAIWSLTIADDDFPDDERMRGNVDELIMSTRLLALCYDIRHAYQGSRNIELVESGMSEWDAEAHGLPYVQKNVEFSVEVLYPEAMYEVLVLNYLIEKRVDQLKRGKTYRWADRDSREAWFETSICIVRSYVSKLYDAVAKVATSGRSSRIRKELAEGYYLVAGMYQQWVDVLNEDYAHMNRKQRSEALSTIVRDLAKYYHHEQYHEIADDIDKFADEHGISRDNVQIPGLYEWDEPVW